MILFFALRQKDLSNRSIIYEIVGDRLTITLKEREREIFRQFVCRGNVSSLKIIVSLQSTRQRAQAQSPTESHWNSKSARFRFHFAFVVRLAIASFSRGTWRATQQTENCIHSVQRWKVRALFNFFCELISTHLINSEAFKVEAFFSPFNGTLSRAANATISFRKNNIILLTKSLKFMSPAPGMDFMKCGCVWAELQHTFHFQAMRRVRASSNMYVVAVFIHFFWRCPRAFDYDTSFRN